MKKTIHYKIFKSDDEMTEFQKENEIGIVQVQPFNHGINIDISESSSSGELSIGVFVVFTYNN